MNRITALLATLAVAFGLAVTTAPAAQAEEPGVCDAACVEAYEDQITELTADRDWLAFKLQVANAQTAAVESKLEATQTSLGYALGSAQYYQGLAVQRLAERDAALALADARLARVLTLRAKVVELRADLRDGV